MISSKKLIINADGFGFTFGNNRAIFEVCRAGNISSISVNTNFPAVKELRDFHDQFPGVSIGVHLNPIIGKPVLHPESIPSLLGPNGEFWGQNFAVRLNKGYIDRNELFKELVAQVEVIKHMDIPITHLDSHQNQHLRPKFFPEFLRVARETGISRMRSHRHFICAECKERKVSAIRYYITHLRTAVIHIYTRQLMYIANFKGLKMADRLISVGHATGQTKGSLLVWKTLISNIPKGTSEIYCHPGYPDETLRAYAQYVDGRIDERKVLLSPDIYSTLKDNGVELIGFNQL